jgi:heat shock protein HslJ
LALVGGLLLVAACQAPAADEATEAPMTEPTSPPAEPTAEVVEKTLFVGPELVDCVGVAPQKCMQVREDPDAEWTMFYQQIDGFTHEPGHAYELRVSVETVPYPPADGSSLRYTLIEVVSREPVEGEAVEGEPVEGPDGLEGTAWLLVSHGDPASPIPVLDGTEITATFSDGQVTGSAGCNTYGAPYTVDGDDITIGPGRLTLMACEEPIMAQEQAFMQALSGATSFRVEGDALAIAYDDGMELAFAAQPSGLAGSAWTVAGYNNGREAVVGVLAGTELTAEFTDDTMAGSAGCNTYRARYSVDGDAMTLGPAATTRMMCATPEGVMEQESQFLAALSTVATWRRDGSRLELRTADGAMAVNLVAAGSE